MSRWISPLLSPFPRHPYSSTAGRTCFCLSVVLQMKKIKTFSSQQLSGSNPGEVKAGLLNSRSHITSQALFSITHLGFFVPVIQFVVHCQPFQQEHQEPLQEHLGHHPLCTASGTHSCHSRNQAHNVESGFLSSALGFHLLTSVCTGFM